MPISDAFCGWTDDNGEPLDTHYNIYNLSAESRSRIVRDCHYFMLVASTSDIDLSGLEAQAGHDFWLTRNGHGTGFWDRPEIYGEENARILSIMSHCFGNCDPIITDDEYIELV